MASIFILIPVSIMLVFCIGLFLWWASKNGQFDDLNGPAVRIIMDDDSTEQLIKQDDTPNLSSEEKT